MGNSESTPGIHSFYEDGSSPKVEGSEGGKESTPTYRKRLGSEEREQQQQQRKAHEEAASPSHRADSSGHAHQASTPPSPRQRKKSPLSPESAARGKLSSSPRGGSGTIDADSGNLFQCLSLGCGSCERPSEYGDRRRVGGNSDYLARDFRGMQWKVCKKFLLSSLCVIPSISLFLSLSQTPWPF